jgi:UDP-glucose 4-epimerase
MINLLLTGASGFIGNALFNRIKNQYNIDFLLRQRTENNSANTFVAEINPIEDYTNALKDKDVVVHCAARVHIMREADDNPLEVFRNVNSLGTINLASQAAKAGVKRFVFISSIKVNGESTFDVPFSAKDERNPQDDYAQSKAEAETLLLDLGRKTGMEIVIVRPPLVYGPGVKANFGALAKLVAKGFPLPFGAIKSNRRSMVYIENLVDFIATILKHPKLRNDTYLVSDDYDLSTSQLIFYMAKNTNKRLINVPVPIFIYKFFGKITGKQAVVDRLTGSLQVDIEQSKTDLSWCPPYTCQQGIAETLKYIINKR